MNILVTGGAGFIGSFLIKKLLQEKINIFCVDNFNDYYNPKLKEDRIKNLIDLKNFNLCKVDIRDFDELDNIFNKNNIDLIVHLAARAGVRNSIEDPKLYTEVNYDGTVNMLELARKYNIKNFVFASSSSVYGGNKKMPFSEDDRVDFPISPYAATKKGTELMSYTYHHLFDMNIIPLRFFTVYGPWGRPDMAYFKFADLILNDEPIPMYGDGTTIRDYTYIDDIIDGVMKSIDFVQSRKKIFEIFNLGNSKTVKLNHFISLLGKYLNKEIKINQMPMQPGDVSVTYSDITKAEKMLGYKPNTDVETGIKNFVKWHKQECFGKY